MKQEESQSVEYKRSWHDEYLRWVCGFANAKGGTLWIGIDDEKRIFGVENARKLMEDIPNKIRDLLGIVVDVSLLRRQKKDVIKISVPVSDFPVAYRGEYHYRTGSTKQLLTGFALTQFLFHKMHLSWDAVETINRLSSHKFTFKRLKYRFEQRAHKTVRNSDLVSYGLVTKDGILTNAGALLTDDCPIPQSRLFCTRWTGTDKASNSAASRKEHGNILELLDMAEGFIRVQTNKGWVKRPTERDNYPDYPERAVTEALVNAFIHRDYTISGSEVHVDIFDDRIEIMSPGGMPDGSLVQDLDVMNVPSDRRNGVLADVFDRLDYMEREGSGFKKIMLAYSPDFSHNQKGLAPKFYSAVGCFVVTLPNLNGSVSAKSHGGAAPEARVGQKGRSEKSVRKVGQKNRSERTRRKLSDRIVALMGKQPGITQQAMVAELGVARSTIILHISALKDSGRIRRVGPDKGGHWEVVT